MITGFDPIVGSNARVLVLGSVPGRRSLEEARYYAQPGNSFWPIVEQLFADGRVLDFEQRYDLLRASGVALWDVIHLAERPGSSSDSAIQLETVVPNDIVGFLREHTGISHVFFNGRRADDVFGQHFGPTPPVGRDIEFRGLPSTSGANAAMSFEVKLASWRQIATAGR